MNTQVLNRKFLTKLLDSKFRRKVLDECKKFVNSTDLKLKQYATYVVDKHAKERDETFADVKNACYGFCPFDVLMWCSKDGKVNTLAFEFKTINHFLKDGKHAEAVEVALCMIAMVAKANRHRLAQFDIDKIEDEARRSQEAYDKMHDELKNRLEEDVIVEDSINEERPADK